MQAPSALAAELRYSQALQQKDLEINRLRAEADSAK